jgi:hypothetical protein
VFAIDVRVHAETEEPERCWRGEGPCAVQTSRAEKLRISLGENQLVMDESTVVVRLGRNEVRLLAGTLWVRAGDAFSVHSEFGQFSISKGEFWVSRTSDRVTGASVVGNLLLKPRSRGGAEEELEIVAGLENWVGKVQAVNGRAQTGVPMPIPLRTHFIRWAHLHVGGREQFLRDTEAFYKVWLAASTEAAGIHQELVQRKLATIAEDQTRNAEINRKVEARNHELVEMLRRRVFAP